MRLLVLTSLLAVATCREKRSIGGFPSIGSGIASIGSIFSPSTPPPHTKYPLWKVHKYSGIQLKPVTHEELSAAHPVEHAPVEHGFKEIEGHPPKVLQLPEYHPEIYRTEPYPAADGETRAALAAIDSLGGLTRFLPEGGRGRSLDLDKTEETAEAEDRIGLITRKPLKLKKKALLALLTLKGGPKGIGGLGGLAGLGGLTSGFQNLFSYAVPSEPEGPYPGHTTVYRTPTSSPQGFLSGFSLFGGGHEGVPVELPESSLPEIPELKLVPEAPKLPHLTLPGNYKLPYSTGSYVSIKIPKPHLPPPSPASEYGVPPSSEYRLPAQHYDPPTLEYGLPPVEFGPPTIEYGAPLQEFHSPPSYSYDANSLHQIPHSHQGPQDSFIPSAPAPPVYNIYQDHVNSYQTPVHEFSHAVDSSSALGVYPAPPPVATATYSYYPPAQGYSYLDNSHSPSELKASVLQADAENRNSGSATNEGTVEEKVVTQKEVEEQQLPETPKGEEDIKN